MITAITSILEKMCSSNRSVVHWLRNKKIWKTFKDMTDWKTYTIVNIGQQENKYLKFELNNSVNYSNGRCDVIRCEVVYPYIT